MNRSLRAGLAGLVAVASLGLATASLDAQPVGYHVGPYFDLPIGPTAVNPGPPIAAGWEALGDGIVVNEPAGRELGPPERHRGGDRSDRVEGRRPSNFDVRYVPRGWVVVWDRLVPLTDLSRNGSLYTLESRAGGRVRVTLDGRELFADVLFAPSYEEARTLLEGR